MYDIYGYPPLFQDFFSKLLGLPFHKTHVNWECKELLLCHAFTVLKVHRVVFQTDELNVRSRRAIEKLGAKFEGIRRDDMVVAWSGRVRSSAFYSILENEWPLLETQTALSRC
jgi:RimJ/RimL family protein N-acetyltransferase